MTLQAAEGGAEVVAAVLDLRAAMHALARLTSANPALAIGLVQMPVSGRGSGEGGGRGPNLLSLLAAVMSLLTKLLAAPTSITDSLSLLGELTSLSATSAHPQRHESWVHCAVAKFAITEHGPACFYDCCNVR